MSKTVVEKALGALGEVDRLLREQLAVEDEPQAPAYVPGKLYQVCEPGPFDKNRVEVGDWMRYLGAGEWEHVRYGFEQIDSGRYATFSPALEIATPVNSEWYEDLDGVPLKPWNQAEPGDTVVVTNGPSGTDGKIGYVLCAYKGTIKDTITVILECRPSGLTVSSDPYSVAVYDTKHSLWAKKQAPKVPTYERGDIVRLSGGAVVQTRYSDLASLLSGTALTAGGDRWNVKWNVFNPHESEIIGSELLIPAAEVGAHFDKWFPRDGAPKSDEW